MAGITAMWIGKRGALGFLGSSGTSSTPHRTGPATSGGSHGAAARLAAAVAAALHCNSAANAGRAHAMGPLLFSNVLLPDCLRSLDRPRDRARHGGEARSPPRMPHITI